MGSGVGRHRRGSYERGRRRDLGQPARSRGRARGYLTGNVLLGNATALAFGQTFGSNTLSASARAPYGAAITAVAQANSLPPVSDMEARAGAYDSAKCSETVHPLRGDHQTEGGLYGADVLG